MTTLTRSTNIITRFVEASQEIAALELKKKELLRVQDETRNEVLQQIGERRTVKVNGAIVTLTPRITESIRRTCDDETAVAFFRSHGLPVNTRSAEYVAPAAFTSQAKKGAIDPALYEVTRTTDINVI